MKTGTTNPEIRKLIQALRKENASSSSNFWKRVADNLEKSARQRRVVNISRIARSTKPNETIIVPGKVLGSGSLPHSVSVAALSFSNSAKEIITQAKGKTLSISEVLKKKPKESLQLFWNFREF